MINATPLLFAFSVLHADRTFVAHELDRNVTRSASCPTVHKRAAAPVLWALAHGGFDTIKEPGLAGLRRRDIKPLTDDTVCAKLDQFYAGSTYAAGNWQREYLTTDGYYIASIYYRGRSKNDVRRGHMAIFSRDLALVAVVDNRP